MLSLKEPNGGFRMHEGGEVDVRGSYCALSTARLLNFLTPSLLHKVADFIKECQTFEGGIGGVPGVEAHGGYTFCALAAAELAGGCGRLDVKALTNWAVSRQMEFEGGFQGRTNKLVDGCYSFWQGGIYPILDAMISRGEGTPSWGPQDQRIDYLMNKVSLQEYILICCQAPRGGLRDKPGKSPDYYHTCYCLSGLSVAQNVYEWNHDTKGYLVLEGHDAGVVVGLEGNRVAV
ncbi:hypothetical protein HDV05_002024 [Chytridiales sp. JEL 0842]|nr:hypothetical protein HDV05_002024 [Chytridiales sp. JEL 0842]